MKKSTTGSSKDASTQARRYGWRSAKKGRRYYARRYHEAAMTGDWSSSSSMKDAFDQWWEWANKVPLGMDPTGEKPCQREEETSLTRLAEIWQMLDDYAKRPASHHQEASPQAQLSAVGWTNRSIRQQR